MPLAPTDLTLLRTVVEENMPTGTVIGKFTTDDTDPNDTFTYSIFSDVSGFFDVIGDTLTV